MRKFGVFLLIVYLFVLSGCAATDDFLKQSGLVSEEEYRQYIDMRDNGELNAEGYYKSKELENLENDAIHMGSVHVTFAHNSSISVQYYSDEMHQDPVNESECYVSPGDYIYASEPDCGILADAGYSFKRFRLYSYNAEGEIDKEILQDDTIASCGFQVPEDFEGTEISVMPIGQYARRQLKLRDYYKDSTGREQELKGRWIINEKEVTGDTYEVNPVEPVTVDYQYDSEKYAYESSTPNSFFHDDGLVRFEVVDALDNINDYSVELRPLNGFFVLDPEKYSFENGNVKFEYDGQIIEEKRNIPDGAILTCRAEPDKGYVIARKTESITVNAKDSEKTDEQIRNCVVFYSQSIVNVNLPRPIGGTIEYCAGGKVLSGEKCELSSGTEITMSFKNWNGWINNVEDGRKYIVTDQPEQSVFLEGIDINKDVFTESEEHKPLLNVVLSESVKDTVFDIKNIKDNLQYEDGSKTSVLPDWVSKTDRLVFSDRIGTYPNPVLNIREDTVLDGNAVRLEIVKTDTRNQEEREIMYIQKLPIEREIEIYADKEREFTVKVYEKIDILVSKVEVIDYEEKQIDHAKISVSVKDVTIPYALIADDVLEGSREVDIIIIPDKGYYVAGAEDTGGTYKKRMKYEKWEKEYERILKKNPVKKIWHVILDKNDSYGNCVYQLDGKEVSGEVEIREGQKLTLCYSITNPNYEIGRSGIGGFWKGVAHKETENCTIPISGDLDGKVIKRQDYIEIKPKEK